MTKSRIIGALSLIGIAALALLGGIMVKTALVLAILITLGFSIIMLKSERVKNLVLKHPVSADILLSIGAAILCGSSTIVGLIAGALTGVLVSVVLAVWNEISDLVEKYISIPTV